MRDKLITIESIASMSMHEAQEAHKKVFASNAPSETKKTAYRGS